MKSFFKSIRIVSFLGSLFFGYSAKAQTEQVLPFMYNLPQATYQNPTLLPEYTTTIGLPFISGISTSFYNSQFSTDDFLRKSGDRYVIDPGRLLRNWKGNNITNLQTSAELFHVRFAIKKSYWMISATQHANVGFELPADIIRLAWEGNGSVLNRQVGFTNASFDFSTYNDIGLGVTLPIKNMFVVGARFKVLAGQLNASSEKISGSMVTDSNNAYAMTFNSTSTLNYATWTQSPQNFSAGNMQVGIMDLFNLKNRGYGFDLGLTYKATRRLSVTGTLTDVGFIRWKHNVRNLDVDIDTLRFKGIAVTDAVGRGQTFSFQKVQDSLSNQIQRDTNSRAYTTRLHSRYSILANYQVFRYSWVGVGLFGETRYGLLPALSFNFTQRLGRILNFSVNYTMKENSPANLGAGIMVKPGILQIYAVTDNIFNTLSPEKYRDFNFRAGVNIAIGNRSTPSDIDGDGVADKDDDCPKQPGERIFSGCPDTDLDGIPDSKDECREIPGVPEFKGCPDSDEDGVKDAADACPTIPGLPKFLGCPDTDGDEIPDKVDLCPTVPGVLRLKGCPDTDGDGIGDGQDKCPTKPGLSANEGCPDTDGDGLFDHKDSCISQAGPLENQGCPWPDVDKDGVFDKDDLCPFEAGDKENKGCPWPDTDSDGINDKLDACPREAGPAERKGCPFKDVDEDGVDDSEDRCIGEKGTKENFGCPGNIDSDNDGILDKDDKCPLKAGNLEDGGCPKVDTDGDGVFDGSDKCPTEIGLKENGGCPDVDTDGDGLVDRLDKCPKTVGTKANNGCPALNQEEVKAIKSAFANLEFERGKDIILQKSFAGLLNLAQVMKDNPETLLLIEGHTDNQGKEEKNIELSKERALAVRFVIVSKGGVESPRVKVGWFGSSKPIASNKTEAGRTKNRRVEMKIFFE